jgi:AraC-like DNA-binding protein
VDAGQTYVERLPEPQLADRVRTVWVQRTGPHAYVQRNLPTGGIELHCPIGGAPVLIGPLSGPRTVVLPPRTTVLGVRFWPGAAAPLLDRPVKELLDEVVPLEEVWGPAADHLRDRLASAPDAMAGLDRLQTALLRRYARADAPDPLVTEAVRRLMPWQPVDIGALTSRLAISSSQLRRRFAMVVGSSPKHLQRTLRFQGYLALAQSAAGASAAPRGGLSSLAAEAGYADHPHLSRECLRLTGLTPRELLGSDTDRCGCGHDHFASYQPFLAGRRRLLRAG